MAEIIAIASHVKIEDLLEVRNLRQELSEKSTTEKPANFCFGILEPSVNKCCWFGVGGKYSLKSCLAKSLRLRSEPAWKETVGLKEHRSAEKRQGIG